MLVGILPRTGRGADGTRMIGTGSESDTWVGRGPRDMRMIATCPGVKLKKGRGQDDITTTGRGHQGNIGHDLKTDKDEEVDLLIDVDIDSI